MKTAVMLAHNAVLHSHLLQSVEPLLKQIQCIAIDGQDKDFAEPQRALSACEKIEPVKTVTPFH